MRKTVSDKVKCNQLVHKSHEIKLGPAIESNALYSVHEGKLFICFGGCFFPHSLFLGSFTSPMVDYIGDLIPKESHEAKFQMILPQKWLNSKLKPVVIHLAGTGDHVSLRCQFEGGFIKFLWTFQYFGRRKLFMARPLLKESGVASVLLENPFCK